ncbi:tif471, partial [Symbiodinium pilosum]
IDTVRAISEKLRWMSDARNGKNTSLSAGASEFVPAAPFAQSRSTKAAVTLSPAAAEFLPEGGRQPWAWNGSHWSHDGNGAWPGDRSWNVGYSANSPDVAGWAGVASSPTCWFNDDAYSTDSSRSSDSEPEAEEADAGPTPALPSRPGPEIAQREGLNVVSRDEIVDDDDDFDSFSEDEGFDASVPSTSANVPCEAEHAAPTKRAEDKTSEIPTSFPVGGTEGAEEVSCAEDRNRHGEDLVAACEELVPPSSNEEQQASEADGCAPKYEKEFMLTMRRIVGRAEPTCHQLPRCEKVGSEEDVPDFLRRREESEQNGEDKWRASRSGEASKARSRTQDAKQKPDKNTQQGDASQASANKLEVSETSWAAQIARRKALSKENSDDSFVKNVRSILNKLTVEKFDTLSEQIIELVSQSDRPNHGIPLLMQLVFEKATTQHHFINMYVGLCVKLHKWLTDNERIDGAESQSNFKRVLLNQCQSSFEQYLEPPEGFDGLTGDDLYEAQVKYKTKMLGNIRLVGELIRHGMLAPKIAIAVASELARDDPAVRSERLETLATFLETVGVALDDPSWKHHHELEMVFEEVVRACSDQAVPRRVRCLLQDVLDLRNGGWKSKRRKDLSKETPQTLAQVHEKAKAEVSRQNTSKSLSSCRAEVSSSQSWASVRDLGRQL